jgi:predicted lipid carrier protein YhbT
MTRSTAGKAPASGNGPAVTFFSELAERDHDPLLAGVEGRVRLDVVDDGATDSWLVTFEHGDVAVGRDAGPADCTIRGKRALFDELARGRTNAMAAVLRGALVCSGDIELLIAVQRIFPDPPRGWDPSATRRGQ